MPTYEYRCTVCGRETEVMHGVHGTGPERCEHCGGAMRKMISAPTIHFKGSGWAGKDARDSGRSRSASSSGGGGSSESKAAEGESKPSGDGKKGGGEEAKPATTAERSTTAESSSGTAPATTGPSKPA
ncbi:MAG: FmdB family zinc ribbon protein [Candidatus Limnocylindrales bacterium]